MKLPSFSYLIENMLIIQFGSSLLLLIVNEHGDTTLFDFETGMFQHEFTFKHKVDLPSEVEPQSPKKPTTFSEEPVELPNDIKTAMDYNIGEIIK